MGSVADYDHLFREAFRHLDPEGYFEMQTADPRFFSDDGTLEKAENANLWVRLLHEASEKLGRRMDQVGTWERTMKEAGFIDIKTKIYKVCLLLAAFRGNADFIYCTAACRHMARGSEAKENWTVSAGAA